MTCIAGCVLTGAADFDPQQACEAILEAQPRFEQPHVKRVSGAAFGCSESLRLPRDKAGEQPIRFAERQLIVADIRIDNREELIESLGQVALAGMQLSDAELTAVAWSKWGLEAPTKLIGDFAIAVFDERSRALHLARDACGQRPLFYAHRPGAHGFASMPSGLLGGFLVDPGLNAAALARLLLDFPTIDDETYFDGIRRVLPGHVVSIGPSGVSTRSFWGPPPDCVDSSREALVEQYHDLLGRAVGSRMRRRSGGLGVQLSSGFDSSAVAATAAKLSHGALPIAFTSAPREGFRGPVPRGWSGDESTLAGLTAKMHRLEHRIIRSSRHPLRLLRMHTMLYQEPDRNVINIDWWTGIMRDAQDRGITVMLTATLGNLTLHDGGLPALAHWLSEAGPVRWAREAVAARNRLGVRWRGILWATFGQRLSPRFQTAVNGLVLGSPASAEWSLLRKQYLDDWPRHARRTRAGLSSGDWRLDRMRLIATQDPGLFNLGALAETGVDERDPMSDRRLVEFSFRLPPSERLQNGVSRPLMRAALANRLPPALLANTKRGLQGADWYEHIRPNEVRDLIDDVSSSDLVAQLLDLAKFRQVVDRWPDGAWDSPAVTTVYRRGVTLTLSTAVFIAEFERRIRTGEIKRFSYA